MAAARQVFLCSGHMVDAPGRPVPRFPPDRVGAAGARMAEALDRLGAGPGDLALTQGAAGADLLFAEAALDRGATLRLLLPLPRAGFIARSVLPVAGGDGWRARFEAVERRLLPERPLVADDVLGPLADGEDPFMRGNLWLLDSALAAVRSPSSRPSRAAGRLHVVCLWDGLGGDGPGGTRHMVDAVRQRGGEVTRIDAASL